MQYCKSPKYTGERSQTPNQEMYTVWFHLCEILEQARLIYSVDNIRRVFASGGLRMGTEGRIFLEW
jgi:hypothetical protein